MDVSIFVSEILEKAFFTEKQLSILMNVDQSTISNWKNKKRNIGSDDFLKLLDLLGYTMLDYIEERIEPHAEFSFCAKGIANKEDLVILSKILKITGNLFFMENLINNDE